MKALEIWPATVAASIDEQTGIAIIAFSDQAVVHLGPEELKNLLKDLGVVTE